MKIVVSWNPASNCYVTDDVNFYFGLSTRSVFKEAGWKPLDSQKWYTPDTHRLFAIKGKLPYLHISAAVKQRVDAIAALPIPAGLEYLDYQKDGILYGADHQHILNADEMGLGKTIQAIGILNADALSHRVLVICPATLKINWKREFKKWDVKNLSVEIIESGRIQKRKGVVDELQFPDSDVVIINFDILESWRTQLRQVRWDVLIVDEAHKLKNPKTGRTIEVFGCRKYKEQEAVDRIEARRYILLTGTPLNKPRELWPVVRALDPRGLGVSKREFEQRYCDGHMKPIYAKDTVLIDGVKPTRPPIKTVWDATGASNLDELNTLMRAKFMIRRMKADVLTQLPSKRRQAIILAPTGPRLAGLIQKEVQMFDKYSAYVKEQKFTTPEFQEMARVRKETGVAKVPFVIEHLKGVLDETDKVCVFAHHHEVVDGLVDAMREFGVAVVDGRTSNADRQKAVDAFQTGAPRVFIGGIQAAGVGLTLTAASLAVFAELGWTPDELAQAEDRLHRITQVNSVLVQYLVWEGSLDERQAQLMVQKQEVSDKALGTKAITEAA
jgi:SWI/SNF-related matrix-associated actin-dependent regulator 1 of chromatin subfamily A